MAGVCVPNHGASQTLILYKHVLRYSVAMRVLILFFVFGLVALDLTVFDARYSQAVWSAANDEGHVVSQALGNWVTAPLGSN